MLIVKIFVILMFSALEIFFSTDKGADLVSGYNTTPKEEKKIDQKALCKYMNG